MSHGADEHGVATAFSRAVLATFHDPSEGGCGIGIWYNALTHNCTTTIRFHVQQAQVRNPLDWRLFVNGKADELLYERGDVNTGLPLDALRARSDITTKARAADQDARFSDRIRDGLPSRPPPAR